MNTRIKELLTKHNLRHLLLLTLIVHIICEGMSRRAIFGAFKLLVDNPIMYLYNFLIILLTYVLVSFWKRKYYFYIVVTTIWIGISVTNMILLGYRTTPLTGSDFYVMFFVFSIINVYLTTFQIVGLILLLVATIAALIWLFRKVPKSDTYKKKSGVWLAIVVAVMIFVKGLALNTAVLQEDFGNMADAFKEYGFAYCFSASVFRRGIKEPDSYSKETVKEVVEVTEQNSASIEESYKSAYDNYKKAYDYDGYTNKLVPQSITQKAPNIIYVQLESFVDLDRVIGLEFSEEVTPNFTALKEQYGSGYLTVPTIGAGTVNTEFEILTGMSYKFFGPGEYPYNTILKETPTESICYNLKDRGYRSHFIHNNAGSFYSRQIVLPNLGFDGFTSLEYMEDAEYNTLGWCNDITILGETLKVLQASEEQDYVFITTMQSHGKYPDMKVDENQPIAMTVNEAYGEMSEALFNGFEYYANQMHETDAFVGQVLEVFTTYEEPTLIVFYGDHLPSLEIENELLKDGEKFNTEYIIWANYPLESIDKNLKAYQLSAEVMDRLDYHEGLLTKFHQTYADSNEYQEELKILQYDMLYGDKNAFEGQLPYEATDITMGVDTITLDQVVIKEEVIVIEGSHFNMFSELLIDEVIVESYLLDHKTLILPIDEEYNGQEVSVVQLSDSGIILSSSNIKTIGE